MAKFDALWISVTELLPSTASHRFERPRRSAGRRLRQGELERFPAKWMPVGVKKTRKNKKNRTPVRFNRIGSGFSGMSGIAKCGLWFEPRPRGSRAFSRIVALHLPLKARLRTGRQGRRRASMAVAPARVSESSWRDRYRWTAAASIAVDESDHAVGGGQAAATPCRCGWPGADSLEEAARGQAGKRGPRDRLGPISNLALPKFRIINIMELKLQFQIRELA
jgi:hypothetical protein